MPSTSTPTVPTQRSTPSTEVVVAYLRYTRQWGNHIAKAREDQLILDTCKAVGITVGDRELQNHGDEFRWKQKLLTSKATLDWLSQQAITLEDWTEGLRMECLTQALKEHLFGEQVDAHYLSNREHYRRVALSQILLSDQVTATRIYQQLQDNPVQFCALALQYSQSSKAQETGGYEGIRYCVELAPEIQQAIADQEDCTILEPVQTALGYHVLKIEAWIPTVLDQALRQDIFTHLFKNWLQAQDTIDK